MPREKKAISSYLVLTLILGSALLFFGVRSAYANLECTLPQSFAGYRVQSCKDAYRYTATTWKGRMVSRVVSEGAIPKLGWHSWTDTTYCNWVPWHVYDYGPSYGYNKAHWASTSAAHPFAQGCIVTRGRVCGNHVWETYTERKTHLWCKWGGPWN